ncbi:MAG: hypothetical protein M3Q03_20750 [Chloroflexota bacterium]|nr:hypothetical protein [Chloroflexota bacterium]
MGHLRVPTQRVLAVCALLLATLASIVSTAGAQDATPGTDGGGTLSQFGLPEVRITIEDGQIQAPAEAPAGQLLLVVDNRMDFPGGVSLIQPPAGTSVEEMMGPPPASPEAGVPTDAEMASPEAAEGGEEEQLPPWFFTSTWAGGAFAGPGMTGEAVITLTPGDWVVLAQEDMAPAVITVTEGGATPGTTGQITADATVELDDFQILLPQEIQAGPQIWEVTNVGDQPHELFITKTPELLTVEQAEQLVQLDPESGEIPAGLPDPTTFEDVGGVAPISQDVTVYSEINLEPGNYVAVCFMPDQETGMPHALKGMFVIFQVGEAGQEVSPPASPEPMDGTPVAHH